MIAHKSPRRRFLQVIAGEDYNFRGVKVYVDGVSVGVVLLIPEREYRFSSDLVLRIENNSVATVNITLQCPRVQISKITA